MDGRSKNKITLGGDMFKKKNKVVPLNKPEEKYKFKGLKRVDECDKLHNFFKTQVKVETENRT